MKANKLTQWILISMALGIGVGYLIHESSNPELIASFSKNIKLLTTIFLRLVQMIIAPLVFCTLVVGIAKLGDLQTVGRVGGKALLWFLTASLISLLLGLLLVNLFQPGKAVDLSNADIAGAQDLIGKTQEFSLSKFINHVFPRSVLEAMADNEVLQLVVFSIFFGVAATALHDYSKPVIKALDATSHIILKMVASPVKFTAGGGASGRTTWDRATVSQNKRSSSKRSADCCGWLQGAPAVIAQPARAAVSTNSRVRRLLWP